MTKIEGKARQGIREEQNFSFPLYQYIPNFLTVLRLLATPLNVYLIVSQKLTIAFWVFFVTCLTDWLDGYLARRWHASSKLGQVLDPLADKFLMASSYITLGLWGFIPFWIMILILSRDILILLTGACILLSRKKTTLSPLFIGKLSTALQMLYVGAILGKGIFMTWVSSSILDHLMIILLYSVGCITILSGLSYAWIALKVLHQA